MKCLSSALGESLTKAVSLPEDKPAVFEVAMSLAYGRTLDDAFFPELTLGEELKLLTAIYVMADKLGMELVGNNIMDRIKNVCGDAHIVQRELGSIYWIFSEEEFILPKCKLRTFLVECLAGHIDGSISTWENTDAEFYTLGGVHVAEVVHVLSGKTYRFEQPWRRTNCEYHNHTDTTTCKDKDKANSKKRKAA
jgi:hypothetical protein